MSIASASLAAHKTTCRQCKDAAHIRQMCGKGRVLQRLVDSETWPSPNCLSRTESAQTMNSKVRELIEQVMHDLGTLCYSPDCQYRQKFNELAALAADPPAPPHGGDSMSDRPIEEVLAERIFKVSHCACVREHDGALTRAAAELRAVGEVVRNANSLPSCQCVAECCCGREALADALAALRKQVGK